MNVSVLQKQCRWWFLLLTAVLAYSGLLFEYGLRLWSRDYFRFFPVYLIAVLGLTFERVSRAELPPKSVWRISPLGMGLSLLALTAACWLWSPLLAAVSLFLLGDSLLCSMPQARSSWRLLAVLMTLPLHLDDRLVHELQRFSSAGASRILDVIGVAHLMRGNVMELPDKRLFVEEACSGVSSVYLLLAFTAFCAVLTEARLIRAIPLLLSVFWWAVVANVIRIVWIGAAHDFYDVDLSTGWSHEVAGIAVLLVALFGIGSTWCLLRLLLDFVQNDARVQETGSLVLTPVKLWNLFTCSRNQLPAELRFPRFTVKINRNKLLTSLSLLLLGCGIFYWGRLAHATLADNGVGERRDTMASADVANRRRQLDEGVLRRIADVQVSHFWRGHVDHGIYQDGPVKDAAIWELSTSFGAAKFFVEGPRVVWQDPAEGLVQSGWILEDTGVAEIPGPLPKLHLVTLQLTDDEGTRCHRHYCLMAPTGDFLPAPDVHASQKRHSFSTTESYRLALQVRRNNLAFDAEIQAEQRLFLQLANCVQHHWKTSDRQRALPVKIPTAARPDQVIPSAERDSEDKAAADVEEKPAL